MNKNIVNKLAFPSFGGGQFGAKFCTKFAAKFLTKFSALFCWDIQSKQKTSAKTSALNPHDPAQQNWRNFREKLHDEVLQGGPSPKGVALNRDGCDKSCDTGI